MVRKREMEKERQRDGDGVRQKDGERGKRRDTAIERKTGRMGKRDRAGEREWNRRQRGRRRERKGDEERFRTYHCAGLQLRIRSVGNEGSESTDTRRESVSERNATTFICTDELIAMITIITRCRWMQKWEYEKIIYDVHRFHIKLSVDGGRVPISYAVNHDTENIHC